MNLIFLCFIWMTGHLACFPSDPPGPARPRLGSAVVPLVRCPLSPRLLPPFSFIKLGSWELYWEDIQHNPPRCPKPPLSL